MLGSSGVKSCFGASEFIFPVLYRLPVPLPTESKYPVPLPESMLCFSWFMLILRKELVSSNARTNVVTLTGENDNDFDMKDILIIGDWEMNIKRSSFGKIMIADKGRDLETVTKIF